MRLVTSIYCDLIQAECFEFTTISGNCPGCKEKINAAAYDMLDYWGYDPQEFISDDTSDFIFSDDEKELIYQRMLEICEERSKPIFL